MVPLIVGLLVFLSSLISLRIGISVAIIEIITGTFAGNLGLKPEDWMLYLANFGGIILTYLAGTEIDTRLMKEKFKESFLMGFFSFILPFIGTFLYTHIVTHWTLKASLIAGTALSTTSLAVVYSVLVETGLQKTEIGKLLMSSTFITDMGTALVLSILFIKPTIYTLLFLAVSAGVIYLVDEFSLYILRNPRIFNKVIEPEIKFIFLVLLVFIFFAKLGDGHAVLPAFVLGLLMSKHFTERRETKVIRNRLRTVAYAMITPIFFIVGGMRVSLPLIITGLFLFIILFVIKIVCKFLGVYFLAKKYIPQGSMYTTLLMSTGLTFGTIASLFGLNAGIINQNQYSILVGVVIASAVIPTFIAQKWFMPVEEEDIIEENGN
ncbi:MAG: potassium transporter [Elusimicrobia bacterium CG1_02_37_114]|nr:MAG: potassium transporter [Elusimicrobia bacterium CG1_02_37_114]PIV52341.1 MAG: cation:proton antiporter [Elusimicrobia bacterium CG02_land_8_20_14_3_00_37_13]PIZ12591.1 MAG: cation:proton antiporter [Elusimicrobia bacterium CG_4_10_14_0_8_um_filter_37_32]